MRIGVLGASFNPPTRGHSDVVNQALAHFDEILLVPSLAHPFGKHLASIYHRLEMLRIFVESWQTQVEIFNVEALIEAKGPEKKKIYTFDVLSELELFYRPTQKSFSLSFIMGPDNAAPLIWKKFYRFEDIEQRWGIFVAKENIPIHSALVREMVATTEDRSKLKSLLTQMVSEPIAEYILQHDLYRDKGGVHG